MKILGIVLPILLSSLTITHGKKKLGLSKEASLDSSPSNDRASSDCEDPVSYNTVPGIVVPASSLGYSIVPAGSVIYSAGPARSVGHSAGPADGSMSLSKKGKKGSGLSYQDVLGSLGKGLAGSFDKKGKGNSGGSASDKPVVYPSNVQPVQYVIPVQPSNAQCDCYDSVPSVVPVSYKPADPVNCDTDPIGPSVSYPNNVGSVAYGTASISPSVPYQKPIGYGALPIGVSISYPNNVDAVPCEPVSVGPSISYPHNVGGVPCEPVSVGPSISYPHNVGAVAYESVSVGPVAHGVPVGTPVSYQKNVGPVAHGVPVGTPVSYQKNVGRAAYGVPVGTTVSYQKSVGPVNIGNNAPTYATPLYSTVGSPVMIVSSGNQPSHNKLGLLAGKKHNPGLAGHYGPPSRGVPAYAPPREGSYVIVPSGNLPHSYGHGYDC